MDTNRTSCASLRILIIVIVCNVLFVLSASDSHGHSRHEHSASHGSITILEKNATKSPMYEELASKVEYESEDRDVRDDLHDHHSTHEHKDTANHEKHQQHQSTNPEMHHQHESPVREMLLDEAPAFRGSDLTIVDSHHDEPPANHIDHTNHEKHGVDDHSKHNMDHDTYMDSHMHMDDEMHMDNHSGMHMMVFHLGINEVVLFKEWKITTIGGMIGSMIGIVILGMFYEGLKYFREHLFKQYVSSMQFSTVAVTGESGRVTQVHKIERHRILSSSHALQTCLHVVQIVTSYFLMLIFMTYNVWLCIAVIVGSAIGYFTFGWKKATVVDITEHCH